jgi:hypothetical protein
MENFSISTEWRNEKNRWYVLSTEGTDNLEAVDLNRVYRNAADAYNQAQWDFNNRASEENQLALTVAQGEYIRARRRLIDYIKNKTVDGTLRYPEFVDPDNI